MLIMSFSNKMIHKVWSNFTKVNKSMHKYPELQHVFSIFLVKAIQLNSAPWIQCDRESRKWMKVTMPLTFKIK